MNAPILQSLRAPSNGQRLRRQTVVLESETVHVPAWVVDQESFREWAETDEFPEKSPRICYLAGEIWIDMSKEQVFTQNQVKTEFTIVLGGLAKKDRLGTFFSDGVMISNLEAELTCKPDGVFVSEESFDTGRIRLVEGKKAGFVELEGSPEMVLEVISDSSIEKDFVILRELYHRAGVREYWIVDARGEELPFDILRRSRKGFSVIRKHDGWLKSQVFGKSFQLVRQTNRRGHPEYTPLVK